jgi:hypothetical protein
MTTEKNLGENPVLFSSPVVDAIFLCLVLCFFNSPDS